MKIGMEYSYPLNRQWYRDNIKTMPWSFVSFRVMEDLAAGGHDCHMFANSDVEEMTHEDIRGVHYHFSQHGKQMTEGIDRHKNWDAFLFNGHPPAMNVAFYGKPRPKKLIQRLHMDVAACRDEIELGKQVKPDWWLVAAPSDAAALIYMGVDGVVEWLPIGVDSQQCIAYKRRWHDRPYDIAAGGCVRWKGPEFGREVMEEARKLGVLIPENPLVCGLERTRLYEMLGSVRFMFYPSMRDAIAPRFLTEAHFAGCRLIVAAESASMVLSKQFYDVIPVLCGGWIKPFPTGTVPGEAFYNRAPAQVAADVAKMVQQHFREQDRSPLDYMLTVEYERKKLKELLTT